MSCMAEINLWVHIDSLGQLVSTLTYIAQLLNKS